MEYFNYSKLQVCCSYLVEYIHASCSLVHCLQGHYKCLKLLLGKGANWKEKDKEGETALHLSTRHKSSKCLSLVKQHLAPGEVDDQDNNKVSLDSYV